MSSVAMSAATTVSKSDFGKTPDGKAVEMYTLTAGKDEVKIITRGARIAAIRTPDKTGKIADVALGYPTLEGYLQDGATYFGSVVGRYGNRIAKGKFSIDGNNYQVPTNNNGNSLHGGTEGFDKRVWTAKQVPNGVEMTLVSPDGDQGYPGTLTAHVTYTLTSTKDGAALKIQYEASTDKPTVVNLTNHAYFNLSGDGSQTILNHMMKINADHYTPVDSGLIPTGNMDDVSGTPMDFRAPHAIGERINANFEQLKLGKGYDHNWILNGPTGVMKLAAEVTEPTSGRMLRVDTTEPGVQFYSGNFLEGKWAGYNGVKYPFRSGFCLETQHYPDSPNHPGFPSTVLRPGKPYHSTTIFTFGLAK